MSLKDSEVAVGYIDTEFSSGDSHKMKTKQIYQEENNNEVDELSKEFSEMGCIVDSAKRPPNICVETCVYESGSDKDEHTYSNEDAYSDEFEDDKSDEEDDKIVPQSVKSDASNREQINVSSIKLSKSQSSMSTNRPPPSTSGRSTGYGSLSIPPTRRINMSFPNDRLREIERHNHILLKKILCARRSRSSIPAPEQPTKRRVPPASVQRKLQQRQIDRDNMILLKKIQCAKSSAYSVRR